MDNKTTILYGILFLIYIGVLINGKNKNRGKDILKQGFKCLQYAFKPYYKNDWKILIGPEIMNAICVIILWNNYQVSIWIRLIIVAIGYVFATIIISLSNVFIIHIAQICKNLENKEGYEHVTVACMTPVILLISTKEYNAADNGLLGEGLKYIFLAAFAVNYFVLEKILIDFIKTDKKVLGTFALSDISFQVIIHILNIFSGAYILIKMYSNQLDFNGSGWELLYEVTIGFLTFEVSFVTATGFFGKVYSILFIVSYIMIFMVYMNFVIDIVPKINIGTENGKLKDENIQKNDSQKNMKKLKTIKK